MLNVYVESVMLSLNVYVKSGMILPAAQQEKKSYELLVFFNG